MRGKYDNDLKMMVVELLNSGRDIRGLSEEYGVKPSMIRRWSREYKKKYRRVAKRAELTPEQSQLKTINQGNKSN